jgi:hypothetical protein
MLFIVLKGFSVFPDKIHGIESNRFIYFLDSKAGMDEHIIAHLGLFRQKHKADFPSGTKDIYGSKKVVNIDYF